MIVPGTARTGAAFCSRGLRCVAAEKWPEDCLTPLLCLYGPRVSQSTAGPRPKRPRLSGRAYAAPGMSPKIVGGKHEITHRSSSRRFNGGNHSVTYCSGRCRLGLGWLGWLARWLGMGWSRAWASHRSRYWYGVGRRIRLMATATVIRPMPPTRRVSF